MTRRNLRETIFLLLFRSDFYEPFELIGQADDFFSGEEAYSEKDRVYVKEKVLDISGRRAEIDAAIDEVSTTWKARRMSLVDLTILRLAVYEIKFDESVPYASAINEAVELAKIYGEESSPSFINGVLARIVNDE